MIDFGIGWSLFAQIPLLDNCWNIRQKYSLPFTQRKIFIVNQLKMKVRIYIIFQLFLLQEERRKRHKLVYFR